MNYIALADTYVILANFSRDMCNDYMIVFQFYTKGRVGKRVFNDTFHFYLVFFRHTNIKIVGFKQVNRIVSRTAKVKSNYKTVDLLQEVFQLWEESSRYFFTCLEVDFQRLQVLTLPLFINLSGSSNPNPQQPIKSGQCA